MDAKTLNDLGQPSYRERRYYEAGREQGMREAATMLQSKARKFGTLRQGDPKGLRDMADAILAAIGEGE